MKLYFPTSSLNFNDMFATESISPKIFYTNRIFGTKRHFQTDLAFDNYYIFLFTEMPYFNLMNFENNPYDEYPIVLELNLDINEYSYHEVNDKIIAVKQTIFFNLQNLILYFFEEEHKNVVLQKSKVVIETKCINKYLEKFKILDRKNMKLTTISKPSKLYLPEYDLELELKSDQVFNNVKGLIYSYLNKLILNSNTSIIREIAFDLNDLLTKSKKLTGEAEFINDILNFARDQIKKQYSKTKNYANNETKNRIVKTSFKFSIENGIEFSEDLPLTLSQLKMFEEIATFLIHNPKSKVGFMEKSEIHYLIENITSNFQGAESEFMYKSDLSLMNRRFMFNDYEVDVRNIQSTVLQNLYTMILKYNNFDEMKHYLVKKDISNDFILYSFIGAFIGFSALDKELVENIFGLKNKEFLLKEIDTLLMEVRENIRKSMEVTLGSTNLTNELNFEDKNVIGDSIAKDTDTNIVEEIQKIKLNKSIQYLTKKNKLSISDQTEISFNKIEKDVKIKIEYGTLSYEITLFHKDNVSVKLLDNFKEKYGIRGKFLKGNYPMFELNRIGGLNKNEITLDDENKIAKLLSTLNYRYKEK